MNDCVEWSGGRFPSGYGYTRFAGRQVYAHRLAWEAAHGPIPDGLVVRHVVCRNPPCVNVAHLALGTHADNMRDKQRDGTQSRGERANQSSLTEEDVRAIRASAESQRALAKRYNVSQPAISYIRRRKTWTHVE